ncbi:N-(5'-phosphoribosyl)anthranilate isomerase [Desulfoplanes formicivorans]|uniref:N-(5'-phosphoribosyl)anthranilate isomerase n=1 Tax=Desulfoplanes formicivorans TaxID=1592317 RepID=A0A194AK90_9BACT|nr:N-(5'-phosphoribosyl)anthranilate isomerase [Desulfoplanes formicivorans]
MVKVCGMTRSQDIRTCINLGVNLLGFIFHPKSPRNTNPQDVPDLSGSPVRKVGVFVNQGAEEIARIMDTAKLDLAQLHGDHTVEACRTLGASRVIKVFWPMRYEQMDDLCRDMDRFAPVCTAFLLDAGIQSGGHGTSLDFTTLQGMAPPRPWILAGGLGPANITHALQCEPDGVDLNSGVESAPGIKDAEAIKQVMRIIRPDANP